MKKSFWVYLILTLSIMVGIFCFSAQPGEESSEISMSLTKRVVTEQPSEKITKSEIYKKTDFVEVVIRKSAHFLIFASLGFCVFMTLYSSRKLNKLCIICIISLIICIIYAMFDEVHQLFVSERSGEVRDVIIDSAGSLLGVLLTFAVLKIRKKIHSKKL